MTPKPVANFAQKQRLVTALKNATRDYPGGATVLRELLQNADDAGATEVRFVLDEETYPVDKLIKTHLSHYQGPALLAFNNARFKDKDWASLSRLGDSLKFHDPASTGKFGRGFNSVYNWTDSPSIVSGERLLILDPHCEESGNGDTFDFVADREDKAIQNHMVAFQKVMSRFDLPFDGTIIRVPLRTEDRARESEIRQCATTVSEVSDVLQEFASEFGTAGLLFLRNIESLEVRSSDAFSNIIELDDRHTVRLHKSKVSDAISSGARDQAFSFDYSFEAIISIQSADGDTKKTSFAIHHSVHCHSMDKSLKSWANEQKMVPWVAVAAQLPIEPADMPKGQLFTVLPLPVRNIQPIHIHGLFSLSPDRGRLHQIQDASTQHQEPATWNAWLLEDQVPIAWTALLSYLALLYPKSSAFERWPREIHGVQDPLGSAQDNFLDVVETEVLSIWPTDIGFVSSSTGWLYTGAQDSALREALGEAGIPVVYVPQNLQGKAEKIFKDRWLRPVHLKRFLSDNGDHIKIRSDSTKRKLVEYLLSEPGFTDYAGLEMFPFMDGHYRSIGNGPAFVCRDELEKELFSFDRQSTIDLEKLSEKTQLALKQGCQDFTIHPSICYRGPESLRTYCQNYIFGEIPNDQDMIALNDEASSFVLKVWTWILKRDIDILDENISCLWLLPLSNGQYRRIKPHSPNSQIYFAPAPTCEMGSVMWNLDDVSARSLPLLDTRPNGLPPQSVKVILSHAKTTPEMSLHNGSNLANFIDWLRKTFPRLDSVVSEERHLIVKIIASQLSDKTDPTGIGAVSEYLQDLRVFQKLAWVVKEGKLECTLTWTDLASAATTVGLLDGIIPVPALDDVQFVLAKPLSPPQVLLEALKVGKCLTSIDTIQQQIIPAWHDSKSNDWSDFSKEQLARFIFRYFSGLSSRSKKSLRTLGMVPVAELNGKMTSVFRKAEDLIDPSVKTLATLCFDDEEIAPKVSFWQEFASALKECGMKTTLDEAFIHQRVRCFASGRYPLAGVCLRAERLLKSYCEWTPPLEQVLQSELRQLKWIPAVDLNGEVSLSASFECRGLEDKDLACSQLPILRKFVNKEWKAQLGWDAVLPAHILLAQLRWATEEKEPNYKIVGSILSYISKNKLIRSMVDDLRLLSCCLGTNGSFVPPSRAFRPPRGPIRGYQNLQPYVTNVERGFWKDHGELLAEIGVKDKIEPADLVNIQSTLEAKRALDDNDLAVAIATLDFASDFQRDSLVGLKVIDEVGKFHPIHDVSYDDLGPLKSKEKSHTVHPDVPRGVINRLGINSLTQKLINGLLELEDADDDVFDQRENVTTRIADTLQRYPIESTFREYLANADDTKGASRISWLLDQKTYPSERLLSPEMRGLQGSALLVHNDGIFTDDDIKGFRNVGEGSKTQRKEAIGQFGRGSQTMFHWTDVPMILTGKYLIILDPQQQVLPKNRFTGIRKPGVRLLLSKLKEACPDQLAPFQAQWGYDSSCNAYEGTIFRFPLRTARTKSLLKSSKSVPKIKEIHQLMNAYFDEARISLLFVRRILSINFSVQGQESSGWSIIRHDRPNEEGKVSEMVSCSFTKHIAISTEICGKDKWFVYIEDLLPSADRFPASTGRAIKNVESGIAALISSEWNEDEAKLTSLSNIQSKMFNTLPLPIASDLPVHVHATFALSGDRQSIAIDEHETQSQDSVWNKYLLQEAIPKAYREFLEELGKLKPQHLFKFWPQEAPPKRTCAELICSSFLAQLEESSQRIFPKAQMAVEGARRRKIELFHINQAVFDFLPQVHSKTLAPLLISLGINLVRDVPVGIQKQLQTLANIKSVTGSLLRPLLRTDRGRLCTEKHASDDPQFWEALLSILIPAEAELKELNGCYVLPLVDGTLAPLGFLESDVPALNYYVASEEEIQVFNFATNCLVSSHTAEKLSGVIKSQKFDVGKLRLSHVERLLKMRPEDPNPDDGTGKWLSEFWKFWNLRTSIDTPNTKEQDYRKFDLEMFRATQTGKQATRYLIPSAFDQLPAVIEPFDSKHKELCDQLPGLYRFDPSLMPDSITHSESSLSDEGSFCRLIKSLKTLAGVDGIPAFLKSHLESQNLETLRNLVMAQLARYSVSEQFKAIEKDVRSLPLWPRLHPRSDEHFISASDALMAINHDLLAPWIKESHRFVTDTKSEECLMSLGGQRLLSEVLLKKYILSNLPSTLDDLNDWTHFQRLVAACSAIISNKKYPPLSTVATLKKHKIAVDGKRCPRVASELYDHEDQLFQSAFRLQKDTRFMHKDLQEHRSMWLELGLRRRTNNQISARDYLQCLNAIGVQLSVQTRSRSLQLDQDLFEVLSPLVNPSSAIQSFSNSDWRVLGV